MVSRWLGHEGQVPSVSWDHLRATEFVGSAPWSTRQMVSEAARERQRDQTHVKTRRMGGGIEGAARSVHV